MYRSHSYALQPWAGPVATSQAIRISPSQTMLFTAAAAGVKKKTRVTCNTDGAAVGKVGAAVDVGAAVVEVRAAVVEVGAAVVEVGAAVVEVGAAVVEVGVE